MVAYCRYISAPLLAMLLALVLALFGASAPSATALRRHALALLRPFCVSCSLG